MSLRYSCYNCLILSSWITRTCYHPQPSCGKVIFLHLCVILFTGGGVSVHGGSLSRESVQKGSLSRKVSVQGDLCPGRSLTRGSLSSKFSVLGSLSRGFSVQGGLCPGGFCSQGLCPGGGLSPEGSLSEGVCPGRISVRETPHMVTCWWYASYWYAFLFVIFLPSHDIWLCGIGWMLLWHKFGRQN